MDVGSEEKLVENGQVQPLREKKITVEPLAEDVAA